MQSDDLGLVERIRAACNGHPHAKIAWPHRILHEAADALEAKDAAIERLVAERDEARRVRRWNIDEMGGTLHVCRGEHDGDACEWESFVPADHLRDTEAQRDRLKAALIRQSDNMAFVINHATLYAWAEKFAAELEEDRQALKDAP